MNSDRPRTARKVLILVSVIDLILSGIVLLIYFGFLPIDISSRNIPGDTIGWIGGVWLAGALAVLVYPPTKSNVLE